MMCLFGLDRLLWIWRTLSRWRYMYIAYPSMYAACLEDHSRGTRTFFLKTTACRSILAFYYSNKHFLPREIDCSSCKSALRSSGRDDWPGAIARGLVTPARVKASQIPGLSPVPTLDEHITERSTVFFRHDEKKTTVVQSHARQRKRLRKEQKAMLLEWSNGQDAPNLVPRP